VNRVDAYQESETAINGISPLATAICVIDYSLSQCRNNSHSLTCHLTEMQPFILSFFGVKVNSCQTLHTIIHCDCYCSCGHTVHKAYRILYITVLQYIQEHHYYSIMYLSMHTEITPNYCFQTRQSITDVLLCSNTNINLISALSQTVFYYHWLECCMHPDLICMQSLLLVCSVISIQPVCQCHTHINA